MVTICIHFQISQLLDELLFILHWTRSEPVTHFPVLEIVAYHNMRDTHLRVNIELIWGRKSVCHATNLTGGVDKL